MPSTAAASSRASFHHSEFPPERLAADRERTISVCVPARDEVETIGGICEALSGLVELGVVDQVVVVDDSTDGTTEAARAHGAEVHAQVELRRELGPVLGKGDAMWRALEVLHGDVVCYVDADSRDFGAHFVCGLVGPLACGSRDALVKGFYRRPFDSGVVPRADGGGRVTELTARPLLAAFYPELAAVHQPLAGEIAAPRDLLETLSFTTGYGVDIGLLIDVWRRWGSAGIVQVDLDQRQNRHRPLAELAPMAAAVLDSLLRRVRSEGGLPDPPIAEPLIAEPLIACGLEGLMPPAAERPPAASLRPVAPV